MDLILWCCLLLISGTCQNLQTDTAASTQPVEDELVEVKRGHVPSFPRVITGKITDADDKPVSGALVEWGPDYPPDTPRETTHSDQDGSYRLEVQNAGGRYKLGISAAGVCPQSRRLVPGPRAAPTELNLRLAPETTIEVTFVGESGEPIPNLAITPMTPEYGFNSSFSMVQYPQRIPGHENPILCDEHGVCRLNQLLPAPEPLKALADGDTQAQSEFKERFNQEGWLSLRIELGEQSFHNRQITRSEYFKSQGKLEVVLPDHLNPLVRQGHDGTIFGQVTDAAGQPVREFQFTIRYRAEPISVNDPDGRFQWGTKLDPGGNYEVRVFAKGFAAQLARIVPDETRQARPLRIELVPQESVEVQFVDQQTLQPIPDVAVMAGVSNKSGWNYVEWNNLKAYADGHHGLETVLHLVSDVEGRVTISESRDPTTLIILTAGYGRTIITPAQRPEPDDSGLIQIPLEPAASILGVRAADSRLSQLGDGISLYLPATDGFEHMFHGLSLNENGECLVDSLSPGRYRVALMYSDGNMSAPCWSRTIDVKAGQHVTVPLGEMTGTLTLSGRTSPFTQVQITRKSSVSAAVVSPGDDEDTLPAVATLSDVDGYFEFNQLHPGTYQIEHGQRNGPGREFLLSSHRKGPTEISLTEDTHADYVTGTVTPPEAAVEAPAKQE